MPKKKSKKKRPPRQVKKRARQGQSKKTTKLSRLKPVKRLRPVKLPKIKRPRFKPIEKATTRDLEKAVSYLKKLGLTKRSSRVSKKNKTAAKKLALKYEDVLRGKAKVVPLKKREAKAFKRQGKRVEKRKMIEPKRKGVRHGRIEGMLFEEEHIDGGRIVKVFTPYDAEHLQQGLEQLRNDPRINRLLERGWKFALQIIGADGRANYSYATMPNIDALRDYLERYNSLINNEKAINILTLIIILIDKNFNLPGEDYRKNLARQRRKQARQSRSKKHYERRVSPKSKATHREYQRIYMRQYRRKKKK